MTRPTVRTVRLHEMARCRAGDKGDDSILVLVPHDAADYDRLVAAVSPEAVAAHFGGMDPACVTVLPLPPLGAAVLTLRGRLAGGVTRSTGIDPHGKTLSGHLLDLELTLPDVPGRTENDQG